MQVPIITIFVRHRTKCPHIKDEFYKRCACPKHLRWTYAKRQFRKSARSRSWAGAERHKIELLKQFDTGDGRAQEDQRGSLSDSIDSFIRAKQGEGIEEDGVKKYRRELIQFRQFCEERNLFLINDIGLAHLTDYRATWSQTWKSSSTRQKVQDRLKSFFKFCCNAGFINKNPSVGLSAIQPDDIEVLPLESAEYERLLTAVPQVFGEDSRKTLRVRSIIRVMRYTGLAIQDAVRLERTALQYDGTLYRVFTFRKKTRKKTSQYVSVPIEPELASELLSVPNDNPQYFFWNTGSGAAVTAVKHWQHDLRRVFRKAGLVQGHPHQLRHTAAVDWLSEGIPLEEVSALLGHKSIKTTQKYYAKWVRTRQQRLDNLIIATWKNEGEK